MAKRTFYMHTLNGMPAGYREQLDYIYYSGSEVRTSEMATSLMELRRKQKTVRPPTHGDKLGYVRVVIDA